MLIQFDHVTRQFNNYTAVDDVSFSISQGEIVGLLGHNGAGKTTTMKLLTGYLEPTRGHVYVDGIPVDSNLQFTQSLMGYLPENCPLWPDMNIVEFLLYQASLKQIPQSTVNDQVYRVIHKTSLADKATQPISTLSKGYRQRVGVASAILNLPKIIILDEPTNGLDPAQTLKMRTLIKELAKTSTVILSTHILQEVKAVCDRAIIIRDGRVITDSRLDDLDKNNGLYVTVDQNEDSMRELCADLFDADSIQYKGVSGDRYHYVLHIERELSPVVSQKIIQAGCLLFEIRAVRSDLETLFKEDYITQASINDDEKYVA